MKKLISALSSLCLAVTSLSGAFPALKIDNAIEANAADALSFDLVPHGKEYTTAAEAGKKNNVYQATAGEELTIDWTITGDQGTAGIQMNFDFTQVEYVSATRGTGYRIAPTYSDYKNSENLSKGECVYTWAQSTEATKAKDGATIYSFNVNVPSSDGTYSVGLSNKDINKVVPVDQTKPYDFTFRGLDIIVGNPSTTKAPSSTAAPGSSVDIDSSTIVFNLVPNGLEYEKAEDTGKSNNVVKVDGGEELKIDWTIRNDLGTAGIQMNFDFTQVEYVSATRGTGYRIAPTYSDYTNSENLSKGECVYTWAQSTEAAKAKDGATIYSFTVKVPTKEGIYSVGLSTKDINKVVPVDQTKPYKFAFFGLDIVVGDPDPSTTTKAPTSTAAPGSSVEIDANTIVFNLVPNGLEYEKAEDTGKSNNVVKVEGGDEVKIDWTIRNDLGTAGIQMNFDFTQVEYVSATRGTGYRIAPTYSDYTNSENLSKGECVYTWAQSTEAAKAKDGATIYSFTVKVPENDGTYSVGLSTKDINKVVPVDQTKPYKFAFFGLDLVVGEPDPSTTENTGTPSGDKLTYDFIPSDREYTAATSASGNNLCNAEPGEELTINWTIKNDQGTAGMQMNLDFTAVDYQGATRGTAYRIAPTFSDYANSDKLQKGEVVYTWAQSTEAAKAKDGGTIYSFKVKAPEKAGDYTVGLDKSQTNKVVPLDQSKPYQFDFHGLTIHVVAAGETTAPVKTTASSEQSNDTTKATTAATTEGPTATTAKVDPAGKAQWIIGEKTVAPGAAVKVPVSVTNDDGSSGFVVDFTYEGLTFDGIEWADGYSGDATINNDKKVVVWADANGSNQNADGIIMYLSFVAPQAKGEYPVNFGKLEVTNTDGKPIEVSTVNGKVIVADVPDAGKTNWVIGTKTAAPGAAVKVPVTVTDDDGSAGFVVKYNYDSKLTFNGIEWANGYEGDVTINDNKAVAVWASTKGGNQNANDVVMYLNFTAPQENGTYPVEFASLEVTNTDGVQLTASKTNGAVIVDKDIPPAGKSNWTIGTETVAAGATARVPVTVTDDEGTAGFVVMFKHDDKLKFTGFEWANGYTGEAELNEDQLAVVWADDKGANQKADGVVLYLNFTAPTDKGEYPVQFSLMDVTDTNQQQLTVTKKDGAVIVDPVITTAITTTGVTTSTSTTLAPGKTGWYIGTEEAAPGATVKVPVTVKGDSGTAGFVVSFANHSDLKFVGFEWGNAYKGEPELNKDEMLAVWAAQEGSNEPAADDAVVLNLVFTAPDAEGTYFVNFTDLEIVDTDQNPLDYVKTNGAVIVKKDVTTGLSETTDENSNTTGEVTGTDAPQTSENETGTTEAVTGVTTVENPTTTAGDETGTTAENPTTTNGEETGTTTTGDPTTTNGEETGTTTTGDPTTTNGEETGTTTTGDPTTTNGEETGTTAVDPTTTNGEETGTTAVDPTTTAPDTTTAPSVTTAPIVPPIEDPGHVVYAIDKVEADAGTIAKVPVRVWYDDGTTGFRMQFTVPEGFRIEGITFGDAYTNKDEYEWNGKDYALVWVAAKGEPQTAKDGAVIATLLISVPKDASGEYPVNFVKDFTDVTGENEKTLEHSEFDGSITVKPFEEPKKEDGNIVFNLGEAAGAPGDQVYIPLTVWFDDGAAEFELTLDVPDGFTIDDFVFGPEYAENGTFTWDPETKTLKWTRNEGSDFVPTPGTEIAKIKVTVPEDAQPGTDYPISISKATAKDKDGNPMKTTANAGKIHVADRALTTQYETKVTANIVTTDPTATTAATTQDPTQTQDTGSGSTPNISTTEPVEPGTTNGEETGTTAENPTTTNGEETGTTAENPTSTTGAELYTTTTDPNTTKGEETGTTAENPTTTNGEETGTTAVDPTTTKGEETGTTAVDPTTTNGEETGTTTTGDPTTTNGEETGTTTTGDPTTTKGEETGTTAVDPTTTNGEETGTTTTGDPTTTPDVTTTTESVTTAENVKIVTSYSISFTPPTRVNYWSHDTRSFKESGGLKDLAASLTIFKFYVNENDEVCDVNGKAMTAPNGKAYTLGENGTAGEAQAFETKKLDITGETHPLYTEDSPIKVWKNEIIDQFGEGYTAEQELKAKHKNKYPMKAYFHPSESFDEDAKLLGDEPIYMGDFNIYIGVKGDYNLDNVVSADDAQNTLKYYTYVVVAGRTDYKLNDDPELDGEDGLIFYLINVRYRKGNSPTDPLDEPQTVGADDAQCILKYYTNKYVSMKDDYDWEDAVGYDLLDKFYGDDYE